MLSVVLQPAPRTRTAERRIIAPPKILPRASNTGSAFCGTTAPPLTTRWTANAPRVRTHLFAKHVPTRARQTAVHCCAECVGHASCSAGHYCAKRANKHNGEDQICLSSLTCFDEDNAVDGRCPSGKWISHSASMQTFPVVPTRSQTILLWRLSLFRRLYKPQRLLGNRNV